MVMYPIVLRSLQYSSSSQAHGRLQWWEIIGVAQHAEFVEKFQLHTSCAGKEVVGEADGARLGHDEGVGAQGVQRLVALYIQIHVEAAKGVQQRIPAHQTGSAIRQASLLRLKCQGTNSKAQ